ncbi:MAG: hypothetical protein KTR14_05965 [Vampirovibrio sp.]|nr:hypothetical protein [Vampirovibrio sp.]
MATPLIEGFRALRDTRKEIRSETKDTRKTLRSPKKTWNAFKDIRSEARDDVKYHHPLAGLFGWRDDDNDAKVRDVDNDATANNTTTAQADTKDDPLLALFKLFLADNPADPGDTNADRLTQLINTLIEFREEGNLNQLA